MDKSDTRIARSRKWALRSSKVAKVLIIVPTILLLGALSLLLFSGNIRLQGWAFMLFLAAVPVGLVCALIGKELGNYFLYHTETEDPEIQSAIRLNTFLVRAILAMVFVSCALIFLGFLLAIYGVGTSSGIHGLFK